MLIAGVSLIVPFVGRTAIGWVVDVTTIGATLIYGFVSAAAMAVARIREDRTETITGSLGLILMVCIGLYLFFPSLVTSSSLEKETFFIFLIWSVLGFLYFRYILHKDQERRFGSSGIVWVALLTLVLLLSLIWMRQSIITADRRMLDNIRDHYEEIDDADRREDEEFIKDQLDQLEAAETRIILMAIGMFGFTLAVMLTNYSYMSRHSKENERRANIDPLTGVRSKNAYLFKEKQINASISTGEAGDFAVAVCDVNGLKKINDTLGHKAGDDYICKACRMVCEIFQHSPVFRVGGDEFVAILTGRDYESRKDLMQILHDRSVVHISSGDAVVSGGISDFDPEKDGSFHDVFERADALMYEEKQLLKGLGSISRDEDPEEPVNDKPSIFNVRKRILIVEDEIVNQMLLTHALEGSYDVICASDGLEALELAKAYKDELALMLLDLNMPRMGGLEVLATLKVDNDFNKIPVLVMTVDQNAEVDCLRMGATDFISKPYPVPEIILARVNRCIELSEDRATIQSTERDSHTRLYNIDYFLRYVNMYDRHYHDMVMDAIVIDINGFRRINERYGRQYADGVLSRIGEKLRQLAREIGGVGCRRGIDTFLLYCPHREDYGRMLDMVAEGADGDADPSVKRVRLRMGVYQEVDKDLDIESRYDRAKLAADSVKNDPAGSIGIYNDEMCESARFSERLLQDFHGALKEDRFKVYFQPRYDIRPDKPILCSAEALVRWDHTEYGIVNPSEFIPLLEQSGLILELDTFVWRRVAERIRYWKDKYGYSVPVSVNVSRIDLLAPNMKEIFTGILDEYHLGRDDITLEITESAYTGDSEQVLSTARELRGMGMGMRIEMDDFGSGYSSLGMLNNLPVDALKLDMSFVQNVFGDQGDVRMIELIIDIADYLQVPVVAEGVETEEQLLLLKTLGCDYVQGYHFSRPVPPEEFESFLIERGRQSVEVIPEVKKTCISIAEALHADFEDIFYVDTLTDYYLEFYAESGRDLKIRPGGTDFYADIRQKLLPYVAGEDSQRMEEALKKENLRKLPGRGETLLVSFRRQRGTESVPYLLQAIRTRSSDDHHIMVGIRPEEMG
ncbi:MAG: EAL domain-containing protein [Eubacterium sp.]|nr:EAL domain-containing protein [Eubacterium sp.]